MPIISLGDKRPQLADSCWIADNATLIGSVGGEANASVWFGAVIRADIDRIIIGENSNVQDNVVLHTDYDVQLVLGKNVTVGHLAMLHGCTVGDGSLIGIGAVVLNRAVIGKQCLVGANALVPEGKTYPDRSLIIGSPAKAIRQLTDAEVAGVLRSSEHYVEQSKIYRTMSQDGTGATVR